MRFDLLHAVATSILATNLVCCGCASFTNGAPGVPLAALMEPGGAETIATQRGPTPAVAQRSPSIAWVQSLESAQGPASPPEAPELIPLPGDSPARPVPPALEPPEPGNLAMPPMREPSPIDDGLRPIGQVKVDIASRPPEDAPPGSSGLPEDLAELRFGNQPPMVLASESFVPWGAYGQLALTSDFCHQPLYFEDINLERYGRSWGLAQPFVSAARFYAAVPALPYKIAQQPPHLCVRDGSPYPAGAPAPHHRNLPPFDRRAALVEAATIVGIILLFP